MTAPSPDIAGQAIGSSVGLDFRWPDRPARGGDASRLFIASGPVPSSPRMVIALACGGRCVRAGRRALIPFGSNPLVPGGADARRRGAEFFVAPPNPWQDAAHDDVAEARHAPGSMLLGLAALHARNVAHGGNQCPGKNLRETSFGGAP